MAMLPFAAITWVNTDYGLTLAETLVLQKCFVNWFRVDEEGSSMAWVWDNIVLRIIDRIIIGLREQTPVGLMPNVEISIRNHRYLSICEMFGD